MNPIRTATGLIQVPAHAAATVVRTAGRLVGWGFDRLTGPSAPPARSPWSSEGGAASVDRPEVVEPVASVPTAPAEAPVTKAPVAKAPVAKAPVDQAPAKKVAARKAPAKKTPAKKTPAQKSPTRKAPAKKASSEKAAVLAPALSMSESEVEDQIIDKA